MDNELFFKLLAKESVKEVPLIYIIKIFSAIQEIKEADRIEEEKMNIS